MNEYATTPPRRNSITNEFIPTGDILRKTIKKSWSMSRKSTFQVLYKNWNEKFRNSFSQIPKMRPPIPPIAMV
jgi:hypothetical protein